MFESTADISFFQMLIKGGLVMVPLAACSMLAVAVIIERLLWGPKRSRVIPPRLEKEAYHLLTTGRYDELLGLCRADNSPLARILVAGLRNAARSRDDIIEAMQTIGKKEAFDLQKRLGILGTIAAVGPLLGLLGTVFGMITTFRVISQHGTGNPALMAGGIAEALITTATGLTVAIPALLFYRFFLQQSRQLIVEMEAITLSFVDEMKSGNDLPQNSPRDLARDPVKGRAS